MKSLNYAATRMVLCTAAIIW